MTDGVSFAFNIHTLPTFYRGTAHAAEAHPLSGATKDAKRSFDKEIRMLYVQSIYILLS